MKWIYPRVMKLVGKSRIKTVQNFAGVINNNADVLDEATKKINDLENELTKLKEYINPEIIS